VITKTASKCLVILSNACRYLRPLLQENVFYVDGKLIDFVSSFPHLGHIITDTLDDGPDITKRLGNFIGQVNDILCFFGKVSCDVKARLFSSTGANCGICQAAVYLLSVRRGAKL